MNKNLLAAIAIVAFSLTGFAHAGTLTETEKQAAYVALDDEYKAFTVYEVVMAKFGRSKPFSNIQRAETTHISALTKILKSSGADVPSNPYLNGDKARPVAPDTLAEACAIGVQAEIDNAALYDDELLPMAASNAELTTIFENLRNASIDKHLPAFQKCAN